MSQCLASGKPHRCVWVWTGRPDTAHSPCVRAWLDHPHISSLGALGSSVKTVMRCLLSHGLGMPPLPRNILINEPRAWPSGSTWLQVCDSEWLCARKTVWPLLSSLEGKGDPAHQGGANQSSEWKSELFAWILLRPTRSSLTKHSYISHQKPDTFSVLFITNSELWKEQSGSFPTNGTKMCSALPQPPRVAAHSTVLPPSLPSFFSPTLSSQQILITCQRWSGTVSRGLCCSVVQKASSLASEGLGP